MIVPAVRVVIQNDNRSFLPERGFHYCVYGMHQERLLVDWIRVSGMTILIGGGLQVADGRQIAGSQSSEEIAEIVLMIRLIRLPDRSDWRQVMLVVCAGVVLERFVVGNVIGH